MIFLKNLTKKVNINYESDWKENEMNEKFNFKIWEENWEENVIVDPKVQEEINKYIVK